MRPLCVPGVALELGDLDRAGSAEAVVVARFSQLNRLRATEEASS